jgi:hypothetical protein
MIKELDSFQPAERHNLKEKHHLAAVKYLLKNLISHSMAGNKYTAELGVKHELFTVITS